MTPPPPELTPETPELTPETLQPPATPQAPSTPKPPEAPQIPNTPSAQTPKRPEPRITWSPPEPPQLLFTPYAWAKLQFFCHHGDTEIGGFGISPGSPAPSPGRVAGSIVSNCELLVVEDFVTVPQLVSAASVAFGDTAVADFFEDQVDAGRRPEQFARIWLHTHPGSSPSPSLTDEQTFQRVFGPCDWAVMFILARGGKTYARLRFNVGPGGEMTIPVAIDYDLDFAGSDREAWLQEYRANIHGCFNLSAAQDKTPVTGGSLGPQDEWFGQHPDEVDPRWFYDSDDRALAELYELEQGESLHGETRRNDHPRANISTNETNFRGPSKGVDRG